MDKIICIDTRLSAHENSIAAYLIPYSGGAILVDPGPGSTLETVKEALAVHHLTPAKVTHVLLTHIHLDHAGAAGWFARQGAKILVHPAGAPHMENPERLLASSRRIYGDRMESTWGEFLSVPKDKLVIPLDGEVFDFGEVRIKALHTPGHAEHHISYIFDGNCFCGDIGGIRRPGWKYVRLPFVPPETNLEKWRESLKRLQMESCDTVAITHFGIFEDASAHLTMAREFLDEVDQWLGSVMPTTPDVETLKDRYTAWLHERGHELKLDETTLTTYDFASPAEMAASGLFRYWHKVRLGEN
jgi:glyoxylase-like metal-dependent hydrolase (beta-lactamase superfamily II)